MIRILKEYKFDPLNPVAESFYCKDYIITNIKTQINRILREIPLNILKSNPIYESTIENELSFYSINQYEELSLVQDFFCSSTHFYMLFQATDFLQSKKVIRNEEESIQILIKIYEAYTLLKKNRKTNRDFSLENIVFNEKKIKLIDMGLETLFTAIKPFDNFSFSIAPETLQSGNLINNYSEVWSLGIIFYYILFGVLPWRGKTKDGYLNAIMNINLKIPLEKTKISDKITDLLKKMLIINYKERISWNNILDFLSEGSPLKILTISSNNDNIDWKESIFSMFCSESEYKPPNSLLISQNKYPSLNNELQYAVNTKEYKLQMAEINRYQELEKIIADIEIKCSDFQNNFILNQNSSFQIIEKNISSDYNDQKSVFASNFQPKSNFSLLNSINQKNNNINKSYFESSAYKSNFSNNNINSSYNKLSKEVENINFVDDYLKKIQLHIEKYNILGRTVAETEMVLQNSDYFELWRILSFLIFKRLLQIRNRIYFILKNGDNFWELPRWNEFMKNEKLIKFLDDFFEENKVIKKNLGVIYMKAKKKVQYFSKDDVSHIEKHINLDLGQDFSNLYFIYLYLHFLSLNEKIKNLEFIHDFSRIKNLIKHQMEIIDCIIISEMTIFENDGDFDLDEFEKFINEKDNNLVKNYIDRKKISLEVLKNKYNIK